MSDSSDQLFTGRYRAMQYVSLGCILLACSVFAVLVGKHWSWGPFVTAVLLVGLGAGANTLMTRKAMSWWKPSEEQLERAASRQRQRNTVIIPIYFTFGIGFGLIAGSIPSYWADVAAGLIILLMSVVVPFALLMLVKRRRNPAGASDVVQ